MESDLRRILALEPDDASALNALGYTLANHNLRLDEALEYVSRALACAPKIRRFSTLWVGFCTDAAT